MSSRGRVGLCLLLLPACDAARSPQEAAEDAAAAPVDDARTPDASEVPPEGLDAALDAGPILGPATRPSAGCSSTATHLAPGTHQAELTHGGEKRSYRVRVPSNYRADTPQPLVFLFHGGGGSGRQFEEASTRMNPVADREGFISVYPDGTGALRSWNAGTCCGAAMQRDIDDVGFVNALLSELATSLCIDEARVYATGMSNGAMLTHRLGCELSTRFAAIAPVAGTDMTSSCTPQHPLPVLHIHGEADANVPWAGGTGCGISGASFTSLPDSVAAWRKRNACSANTQAYAEQGNGRCERHTGCREGADVVLCSIEGGGHSWPGGDPGPSVVACASDGPQSTSFLASEQIWSFFSRHRR